MQIVKIVQINSLFPAENILYRKNLSVPFCSFRSDFSILFFLDLGLLCLLYPWHINFIVFEEQNVRSLNDSILAFKLCILLLCHTYTRILYFWKYSLSFHFCFTNVQIMCHKPLPIFYISLFFQTDLPRPEPLSKPKLSIKLQNSERLNINCTHSENSLVSCVIPFFV